MLRTTLITLIAAATLAVPASASAANFYVDHEAGDDNNTCTSPASSACEHIQAAVFKAGTNDTIHVADPDSTTIYDENVNLVNGISLVSDSSDRAEVILDGGAAGPAVTIFGNVGGTPTIDGFTIRGRGMASLIVQRPTIVTHNTFDEPGPIAGGFTSALNLQGAAGGSVVSENTFIDSNPVPHQTQLGIASDTATGSEISGNGFFDLSEGIHLDFNSGGQPLISGNKIVGIHANQAGSGAGIYVFGGHPVISDNAIKSPSATAGDVLSGVVVSGFVTPQTGATLHRNVVLGMTRGIDVQETGESVSLDGDLIADSTDRGLILTDAGADQPDVGDVTATNVTITGSKFFEAAITQAQLTLDSSIIGDGAINVPSADGTCTITYSRGPKPGNAANGCNGYQTDADPGFVSPASANYRLAPGSAMLDAGNPAAPPAGAADLDGDGRALASTCPGGAGTRDIGADEFVVACAPPPPPPPPPANPDPTTGGTDPASGSTEPATGDTQQAAGETEQQVAPDTDPPETTLAKTPRKRSARRTARFGFTADEPGSSFRCKLDRGQFAPCSSPTKLKRLRRGRHSFRVAAVDAAGNVDPTPATYRFKTRARKHAA